MTRRFYYFPLDQLAPQGGELALAGTATPTPDLFAPDASTRLQSFGVKPDDLLALTNGKDVVNVVHLTALPVGGAPTWRRLPLLQEVAPFASVVGPKPVPPENFQRFHLSPAALLALSIPAEEPTPATGALADIPGEIPFRPFTADTRPQNLLLHGPPGTGKTWALKERALQLAIKVDALPSPVDPDHRKKLDGLWLTCIRSEQIAMCTFHQAYTYEEFVEGIRPRAQDGKISYNVEDGLFKKLSLLALAEGLGGAVRALGVDERLKRAKAILAIEGDPRAQLDFTGGRQFVLVIDEINRANVARVMGELITLLEDDKRIGGADPIVLRLPASGERFAVPPNLHVIGTLNTADRSIALMDVALRRRFTFEEKRPDVEVLRNAFPTKGALSALVVDLFTTINQRLLFLHDREHQIGHAYFLKVRTIEDLRDVMVKKVLPLLQEYFFGQWVRVALVLGHEMEDGGRTPTVTGNDASVLQVTKIAEIQTLGFNHDDYEDQHTVEVHAEFKSSSSRAWLVNALVAIAEVDVTKRGQRVKAILDEAQLLSTGSAAGATP